MGGFEKKNVCEWELGGSNVTDKSAEMVSDLLKSAPRIEAAYLRNFSPTFRTATYNTKKKTNLIGGDKITDKGVAVISDSIKVNKNLKRFYLRMLSLCTRTKLKKNIEGYKVTGKGLLGLVAKLVEHKSLAHLSICNFLENHSKKNNHDSHLWEIDLADAEKPDFDTAFTKLQESINSKHLSVTIGCRISQLQEFEGYLQPYKHGFRALKATVDFYYEFKKAELLGELP